MEENNNTTQETVVAEENNSTAREEFKPAEREGLFSRQHEEYMRREAAPSEEGSPNDVQEEPSFAPSQEIESDTSPIQKLSKRKYESDDVYLPDILKQAEVEPLAWGFSYTKTDVDINTARLINHLTERTDISPDRKAVLMGEWEERLTTGNASNVFPNNPVISSGVNLQAFHKSMVNQEKKQNADAAAVRLNNQFEQIQDLIVQDPEKGLSIMQNFSDEYFKTYKEAGLGEAKIQRQIKQLNDIAGEAAFTSILQRSPEEAAAFLEANKEAFNPVKLVKNQGKVIDAIKKRKSDMEKQTIADMKNRLLDYDQGTIREISKRTDAAGVAAQKIEKAYNGDPLSVFQNNIDRITIEDPSSLAIRAMDVEAIEENYRPEEPIPLFTKDNLKALSNEIKLGSDPSRILYFFRDLNRQQMRRVYNQLDSDGNNVTSSLSSALKVLKEDRKLAQDILRSASSNAKADFTETDVSDLSPYSVDEGANNSVRDTVRNLSKLEEYKDMEIQEIYDKVTNTQEVDSGFMGFGGYKLPLPEGVDGKTFTEDAYRLFDDPRAMSLLLDREPAGGFKSMDFRDVQLEAVAPGKYRIKQGSRNLTDTNGNVVIFDYNKYMDLD